MLSTRGCDLDRQDHLGNPAVPQRARRPQRKRPQQVSVRIWGSTGGASEIQAYVDLAGYDKGVHQVPVKLADVGGALFTSVQPKQVEITLEALGERVMSIKHEIKQSPQPGYAVTQVLLSPIVV